MSRAGISGKGIISSLGRNCGETYRNLLTGTAPLPALPKRFKTDLALPVFELDDRLPEGFHGGYPLYFLEIALEEALRNARLTPEILRSKRVGVVIGTTVACQLDSIPFYERLRKGEMPDTAPVLNYVNGMPAEYVRRKYGLNGPAVTVSNACASGADAAMIGLNWLKTDRCDLVIAGGCDAVGKVSFDGFNALRVCSPEPCRPFDEDRKGLNLGDAAGVVILEDPADAEKRGVPVEFELAGAGKTADAFHITQPEGSGAELEKAVRIAMDEAGITTEQVGFINAHGTGTLVNDRVESAVLSRIFGSTLKYHSTKAMTGHTLGAAGTIELIFTEMMLHAQKIAPSLRCDHPAADVPISPVCKPMPLHVACALSTSLAFGGSNTALAVRAVKAKHSEDRQDLPVYISLFRCLSPGEPEPPATMAICRKYGLRRLDRMTQLFLCAADQAAEAVCQKRGTTALITVSAYGPAVTNCKVLDDILDYPEDQILPTCFSHSVLNAAASYVGAALKIHGPTFAVAGFEDPFREAVDLARSLLSGKCCERVLIVAGDEKSMTSEAAETQRISARPKFPEGACSLVLTLDPAENHCGILCFSEDVETERLLPCGIPLSFLDQFYAEHSVNKYVLNKLERTVWQDWQ